MMLGHFLPGREPDLEGDMRGGGFGLRWREADLFFRQVPEGGVSGGAPRLVMGQVAVSDVMEQQVGPLRGAALTVVHDPVNPRRQNDPDPAVQVLDGRIGSGRRSLPVGGGPFKRIFFQRLPVSVFRVPVPVQAQFLISVGVRCPVCGHLQRGKYAAHSDMGRL
ncbi:hypothetical protein ACFQ60_02800 [Streptomyces zhihengii]